MLDPTGEQYGILQEHRFLPWTVYKEHYVMAGHRAGYTTFKGGLSFEQLEQITEANSGVWTRLRLIMRATLHQWLAAGETFDLVEKLKANIAYAVVMSS